MALQTLDPLALSATKLQAGGMDAQEVAYKRKAMEDDLAKTQLALATKNKEIDQKQKEADQKLALMPTYNTLSQQHTKFAFEWMSKEKETRAAEELAYRQGLGGNPNDPTTPEGLARWNRTVNYGQIAANSKQMESTGSEWLKAIAAHPTWYKPNAKDEIYKWQTSTEPLLTGEVANMPQELFDLQGAIADQFGKIEKELAAGASADGTSNWSDEFIPSEAFLTTAEMFATEPNAQYALEQQFKEFTPEKQAQIKKDAAKYKTNVNTAMAMDAAKALYDRKREVRASEQTNDGGSGAALAKGSLWFGKYLEDVMAGDYATEGGQTTIVGSDEEGYADIQAVEKDFPGWKGYTKEVPNNLRKDNTLKGFTWDDKVVYDPEAKTQVRTIRDIKKVAIDYEGKKFLVAVGPAGPGKANETVEVPFDQAESKLGPMILGHNKNLIAGQGAYDRAAETTGEGTRKGAGAQNIVKTPTTAPQPKAETPAEAWARKQKEAAAAKAGK